MDRGTVFYSWQTDSPTRVNRNLIEKALNIAIEGTNAALHLALAIDQDSRGEGGSPVIGEAVKAKVQRALAFVADVTIVEKRKTAGGLVNSNVAVEWGWAGAALGNDGLVGVMNTAFGDPQELPVDIHPHLVPVRYAVSADADDDERRRGREALAEQLTKALRQSITTRFFRGMHSDAPRVVEHIVRSANDSLGWVEYAAETLAAMIGVTEEAALAIMEDLNRAGLVTSEEAGYAGSGFMVRPLLSLFAHFDPLYMGWNADRDARQLAVELMQRDGFNVPALAEELQWPARRMNPAIFRLEQGRFARASDEVPGLSPFHCVQLERNENTRAFADGRAVLPSVAQRAGFQID